MEREDWDERYAGTGLLWHADPNRFLVEQTRDLDPGSVLDLACGEGRNAIWLAERGWRATGVDFSGVALAKGRQLAAERGVEVRWVEADVRTWHAIETFDLVAVFYLQLPAEERRRVYTAAAEAVSDGGHILIVGHDLANLSGGIGGPQDPAVLFTADDVVGDIERAAGSFRIEQASQVRRPVATDDGEFDALDVLVRALRLG